MQTSVGCGCIGLIPAIIIFGVLLLLGYSFWVAFGAFWVVVGVMMFIGLIIDFLGAIVS